MRKTISLGRGEFRVADDPEAVLVIYGLGSCVGLTMYDPSTSTGAMAHIVLPRGPADEARKQPGKFADYAVPFLLHQLEMKGARRERLVIRIAGGSDMFAGVGRFPLTSLDRIGLLNVKAVQEAVQKEGLRVHASDVEGQQARTMLLFIDTGRVLIRKPGQPELELE